MLPSSQYYLVSENADIGLIEKNSGMFLYNFETKYMIISMCDL